MGTDADADATEPFTDLGTLGVEEEFYVVDEAGRPTAGTDELVYEHGPPAVLEDRLDHELFKCVIETQTPVCADLSEAEEEVRRVREALVEHARAHGYDVAGAGLHPAAKWRELEHAEKPRYRAQLDRIGYPQWRNTTAGVHVHVGVDDPEAAMWVANELRWYLPVMLALSVNSPYWNGFDTGLQSARSNVFEALPNTGMPGSFDSYADFVRFERRMVEHGSINDRGELWYDVRPHTEYGTVELRAPDGQAATETVLAFVEYARALVVDLAERYADGEPGHDLRRELLAENKWRALRYGHDATFLRRDGDGEVALETVVEREVDRLGVTGIRAVFDDESGAERQRRLRREAGLDALCEALRLAP